MSFDYEIYKTFKVVNGEMQGFARTTLKRELAYFEGMNCEMIIRKKKRHRSTLQNNLMWMYNTMIGNELGWQKEDVHFYLKNKFLTYESVIEFTGEVVELVKSTRKLSNDEFTEYLSKMQQWAAEHGIILPDAVPQQQMPI